MPPGLPNSTDRKEIYNLIFVFVPKVGCNALGLDLNDFLIGMGIFPFEGKDGGVISDDGSCVIGQGF